MHRTKGTYRTCKVCNVSLQSLCWHIVDNLCHLFLQIDKAFEVLSGSRFPLYGPIRKGLAETDRVILEASQCYSNVGISKRTCFSINSSPDDPCGLRLHLAGITMFPNCLPPGEAIKTRRAFGGNVNELTLPLERQMDHENVWRSFHTTLWS